MLCSRLWRSEDLVTRGMHLLRQAGKIAPVSVGDGRARKDARPDEGRNRKLKKKGKERKEKKKSAANRKAQNKGCHRQLSLASCWSLVPPVGVHPYPALSLLHRYLSSVVFWAHTSVCRCVTYSVRCYVPWRVTDDVHGIGLGLGLRSSGPY